MHWDPRSRLLVEQLPLKDLHPDPRNPRQHSDRQIKQIGASIKSFGFNVPVLVGQGNCLLAGHGRLEAARRLGYSVVPAIRLEHLSPSQARAFSIADNRLTEISTWDEQLLGEILTELSGLDLDFNLEDTGFSVGEIDLRIESLKTANPPDLADDVLAIPATPPVTRLGDLWLLGRHHRLLCGDAMADPSYQALLQGRLAQAVFTDPPYNVRVHGHVSGKGRTRHREFAMASGEMSDGQFAYFLTTVAHLLARHSARGSLHYICMDWRHQSAILSAGQQAYSKLCNLCVWAKDNAGMGSLYRSQHELIFVFKSGNGPHRNNVQLGQFGRNRTNVWNYPCAGSFGRAGEEGNLQALHPTVKPVALVADAILDCTARGDLVLDPFSGSGSTLMAAQRVGRDCCAMEIDPIYVDLAITRWQRHTGDAAILARTGQRFDDIARDARGPA
jgi:ParB-like chromosome segregation protein Spo0J